MAAQAVAVAMTAKIVNLTERPAGGENIPT
jgi:hypothetical protein